MLLKSRKPCCCNIVGFRLCQMLDISMLISLVLLGAIHYPLFSHLLATTALKKRSMQLTKKAKILLTPFSIAQSCILHPSSSIDPAFSSEVMQSYSISLSSSVNTADRLFSTVLSPALSCKLAVMYVLSMARVST